MNMNYKVINKLTREKFLFFSIEEVKNFVGNNKDKYLIINLSQDLCKDKFYILKKTHKKKGIYKRYKKSANSSHEN